MKESNGSFCRFTLLSCMKQGCVKWMVDSERNLWVRILWLQVTDGVEVHTEDIQS